MRDISPTQIIQSSLKLAFLAELLYSNSKPCLKKFSAAVAAGLTEAIDSMTDKVGNVVQFQE